MRAIAWGAVLRTLAIPVLMANLAGCRWDDGDGAPLAKLIGNPQRGAALIKIVGCGACHSIPGIDDADGNVGPPLDKMGQRIFIAGVIRNTPDAMVYWLQNPQKVMPGGAMPNLGLDERSARDITAYLYEAR